MCRDCRTDTAVKHFLAFRLGEVTTVSNGLAADLRAARVHDALSLSMLQSTCLLEVDCCRRRELQGWRQKTFCGGA